MPQQESQPPAVVTSGGNWEYYDEHWLIFQEKIKKGFWLCCFKRPDNYEYKNPPRFYAYVNVFPSKWSASHTYPRKEIEKVVFKEIQPLELECFMEHFRQKYK